MIVSRLLLRARLRASWRAVIIVVVIIGVGSGVALAAVAGARRTAGANATLLSDNNSPDIEVSYDFTDPDGAAVFATIPEIADFTLTNLILATAPELPDASILRFYGPVGGQARVNQPIVRAGRLGEAADEVAINLDAQRASGVQIGDRVTIVAPDRTFEDFATIDVEVVGVIEFIAEIVQDETQAEPTMYLSPALIDVHAERVVFGSAELVATEGAADRLAAELATLEFTPTRRSTAAAAQVQESLRVLVVALTGFGVLAGAATIVAASQAMSRGLRRTDADERSLAAIGCTLRQRVWADALVAVITTTGGVSLGILLAIAASPAFPLGSVRRIPNAGGIDFDLAVLLGGGLAATFILGAIAVATSIWHRGRLGMATAPGRAPTLISRRPTAATGVKFATGRPGLALVVTSLSAVIAIAATTATFAGSLDRLIDDPARSGFVWDLVSRDSFMDLDDEIIANQVAELDDVLQASGVNNQVMVVDGAPVQATQWSPIKGPMWPPVLRGRPPAAPFEILAGQTTLDRLGLDIGDSLTVIDHDDEEGLNAVYEFMIVGTAISPAIGLPGVANPRLDEGLLVSREDVNSKLPVYSGSSIYLFDLADGVDPVEFQATHFPDGFDDFAGIPTEWFTSADPSEVVEAASARPAMTAAAAVLMLVVITSVLNGLVVFVRARRETFVVLSTIGFTPRQIGSVLRWQGAVAVVVSLAIGVPIGIAAGRWLWQTFANDIGVFPDPDVPWLTIGAGVALVIVGSIATSLLPAVLARRTRPSDALRAT